MANGVSALQLVSPEPAPAPSNESIERVGTAVADAAQAVSRGCYEWGWGGGLTGPTKELGAECISALYWLSQSPNFDFSVARLAGRRVLMERNGPDAHEPTIDVLVDGVFEILTKVIVYVRATAN